MPGMLSTSLCQEKKKNVSLPQSSSFLSLPRCSFVCEGKIIGISWCRCTSIPQLPFLTEFYVMVHTNLQYLLFLTQHAWHKPAHRNVPFETISVLGSHQSLPQPKQIACQCLLSLPGGYIVSEICVPSYAAWRNKKTEMLHICTYLISKLC